MSRIQIPIRPDASHSSCSIFFFSTSAQQSKEGKAQEVSGRQILFFRFDAGVETNFCLKWRTDIFLYFGVRGRRDLLEIEVATAHSIGNYVKAHAYSSYT